MQYPTSTEVENCLKGVASEIGDTTESPFRVDVVAQYGGTERVNDFETPSRKNLVSKHWCF
jgi:hypothetical protein